MARQKGRPASLYPGAKRNATRKGYHYMQRAHRRARWKALGLGRRLAERRAAA